MNLQCFTYKEMPFYLYYWSISCLFPFWITVYERPGNLPLLIYLFRNIHKCKDSWPDDVPRTTCNSKNRCFRLSVMLIPWVLMVFFLLPSYYCFFPSFSFFLPFLAFLPVNLSMSVGISIKLLWFKYCSLSFILLGVGKTNTGSLIHLILISL